MKVLIYIAETGLYSSVGIHLDIALEQIRQGNEVFILNCDQSIGGCMENPHWNPLFVNCVWLFKKKDMKHFLPKGVEQPWMKEFVKQLKEEDIPKLQYDTVKELRALTFHGVDIGMGVMSTYISQTRNLNPEINEKSRAYFDALIREQIVTTLVFERLQKNIGLVWLCSKTDVELNSSHFSISVRIRRLTSFVQKICVMQKVILF